jgi:hypothetical protein
MTRLDRRLARIAFWLVLLATLVAVFAADAKWR